MTDVVALQTLRRLIQIQHFGQCLKPRCRVLTVGQACAQCLLCVGHGQLLPARTCTTHPMTDGQLSATQLMNRLDQRRKIFVNHIDDQFARQIPLGAADEVLAEKRGHDLRHILFDTDLRKEILAAQHAPAADADQMHTGTTRVDESRDDVDISRAAFHALLILDPAQQRDLIAQLGSSLELKVDRRLFHRRRQFVGQRVTAPLKKHDRVTHVFGIDLRLDQPDARRFAAFDLILQTWPGTVLVVAVFTLANEEGLLQQTQAFAYGAGARIRTEILALGFFGPAMNAQARKLPVGQKHVGIGFVVAQQDVVRRPPLFDQRLFKQQRFGFVGGDGRFDLRNATHQRCGFRRQTGFAKVAGQAFFQIFGLAHVQQACIAVEHAIDARAAADCRQKRAGIECVSHGQRLASTMP
ncbi:hypothetical protein PS681_04755 [Pseudomonas fluorescens]|nr:hypothetical protein PS681_04755 [Pseudomonas fluorescens]